MHPSFVGAISSLGMGKSKEVKEENKWKDTIQQCKRRPAIDAFCGEK